jgi:hypothetical protein
MIFDNTKIKQLNPEFRSKIPFKEGAKEIIAWYDEKPIRKTIDKTWDLKMDELLNRFDAIKGLPI